MVFSNLNKNTDVHMSTNANVAKRNETLCNEFVQSTSSYAQSSVVNPIDPIIQSTSSHVQSSNLNPIDIHNFLYEAPNSEPIDNNLENETLLTTIMDSQDEQQQESQNSILNADSIEPQSVTDAFALACIITKTPRTHVNIFLKALKPFIPQLPDDFRSLLKTSRKLSIAKCGEGQCFESSIASELMLALSQTNLNQVTLDIHIDGVPLTKSSKVQLWPILCIVRETQEIITLRIFEGKSKPTRQQLFGNVIEQLLDILKNGIMMENLTIPVVLGNFLCDSPARALILNITYHSGTFPCHLCHVKMTKEIFRRTGGIKETRRNNFSCETVSARTDTEFRCKTQYSIHSNETYHHSVETIEIEALPIDIPHSFPVDYMHSVLLGVVKHLLTVWTKTINNFAQKLNEELLKIRGFIPSEFVRKCRDVTESWKATEYRLFLLYVGPIILKSLLSEPHYNHFLKLSVGVRILCSKNLMSELLDFADETLIAFVNEFQDLYDEPITYNLHMTTHLGSCCKEQKMTLDQFSCFGGENHLQKLTNYYDRGPEALRQIIKRLGEEKNVLGRHLTSKDRQLSASVKYRKGAKGEKVCQLANFCVATHLKDAYVQVKGFVVQIIDIKQQLNGQAIFEGEVVSVEDLFTNPLRSSIIRIYKGHKNRAANHVQFCEEDICSKYLAYPSDNCFTLSELLHSKFLSIRFFILL